MRLGLNKEVIERWGLLEKKLIIVLGDIAESQIRRYIKY